MRKRAILALILAAALALATSCSLVYKDPEVDKQTVIIDVAGKTFTKGEVNAQVDYQLAYQQYMYGMMYGYDIDITDPAAISEARDSVINALIENTVVEAKAAEMNMHEFTEDELAEMTASADETYNGYLESVKSTYFAETELTGEELDKAVEEKLVEVGYESKETILDGQKQTKALEKLKAEIVKDVAVTDEEVLEKYNSNVESAKQSYEADSGAYANDAQNGGEIYFTPEGYRYVKHILVKFTDEDSTKINELQSTLSDKQTQLSNVEASIADMGEATEADTEEQTKQRKDLDDTKAALDTEIADLQAQLDAAKEAAYTALQPTIDEILAKIAEGADFDALVAEYGQDPGMTESPAKETGYPVSAATTSYDSAFQEASMALAAVGDISPATRSSFGIHIIKYDSDITSGETPLDEVKDSISAELLTEKQDALFTETVQGWVKEANAKVFKDLLND